ncbi:hypothetical protein R6Q59_019268 [Mikania micrantha]
MGPSYFDIKSFRSTYYQSINNSKPLARQIIIIIQGKGMSKALSVFLIIFFFLLISSTNEATSSPQEYWRSIMKDEPIPKTIQDVLPLEDGIKVNKNTFIRNFDLKPNLIIYRSHVVYSAENHHIVSSSSTFDELN